MTDLGKIFGITRRNGTREFTCTDCGYQVFVACDFDGDGTAVCWTCRYIGEHPQLPEEVKRLLRGDQNDGRLDGR